MRAEVYDNTLAPGLGDFVRIRFANGLGGARSTLVFKKFDPTYYQAVANRFSTLPKEQPALTLASHDFKWSPLERTCDKTQVLENYSRVLAGRGDVERARETAEWISNCAERDLILQAELLFRAGYPKRALSVLPEDVDGALAQTIRALGAGTPSPSSARFSRDLQFLKAQAQAHLTQGDHGSASTLARGALAVNARDAETCYLLAQSTSEKAEREKALECFERFRDDPSVQSLVAKYRASGAEDVQEANPLHVHEIK
jgi:tetratricopeptide (TPR) repeat protein